MSDKILRVSVDATRQISESNDDGYFYTRLNEEDVNEWLEEPDQSSTLGELEDVFSIHWRDWYQNDTTLEDYNFSFEEVNDEDELKNVDFKHDEVIQKYIDERPKRNREQNLNRLRYRITSNRKDFHNLSKDFQNLSKEFKEIVGDKSEESFDELEQQVSKLLDCKKDLVDEEVPF